MDNFDPLLYVYWITSNPLEKPRAETREEHITAEHFNWSWRTLKSTGCLMKLQYTQANLVKRSITKTNSIVYICVCSLLKLMITYLYTIRIWYQQFRVMPFKQSLNYQDALGIKPFQWACPITYTHVGTMSYAQVSAHICHKPNYIWFLLRTGF